METEKKYLKTIEEVSDALAAGKIIYDKYEQKTWKDKNGFFTTETKSGKKYLSKPCIDVEDRIYIMEPKPLEVKLWHLYENKEGRKVFIIYKGNWDDKYVFFGTLNNSLDGYYYNNKGKCRKNDVEYDLVKEIADLSKYFEKGE